MSLTEVRFVYCKCRQKIFHLHGDQKMLAFFRTLQVKRVNFLLAFFRTPCKWKVWPPTSELSFDIFSESYKWKVWRLQVKSMTACKWKLFLSAFFGPHASEKFYPQQVKSANFLLAFSRTTCKWKVRTFFWNFFRPLQMKSLKPCKWKVRTFFWHTIIQKGLKIFRIF